MFIAVLFTIAKRVKQFKCLPVDEWINKMCVCINEILALKKEEICHTLQYKLKDNVLGEISQSPKKKKKKMQILYHSICMRYIKKSGLLETGAEWWFSSWESGEWSNGY